MLEESPVSCGNFSDTKVQRGAESQYGGVMSSATVILMPKTTNLRTNGPLNPQFKTMFKN
jgi:hypothetical protein